MAAERALRENGIRTPRRAPRRVFVAGCHRYGRTSDCQTRAKCEGAAYCFKDGGSPKF